MLNKPFVTNNLSNFIRENKSKIIAKPVCPIAGLFLSFATNP